MTVTLGPRMASGFMVNRPFSAKIQAAQERRGWFRLGGRSAEGAVFRDSKGRVRFEYGKGVGKPYAIAIVDEVARKLYSLNPATRTYSEMPLMEKPPVPAREPPAGVPRRRIENLDCYQVTVALPGIEGEAWISIELQHVVEERFVEQGSLFTWRIYDIKIGEPDPSQFQIPRGFRRT